MKNQVLIHVLGSILFILLIVGYWDVVWLFQECTSKIVITYVRLSDFPRWCGGGQKVRGGL